MASQRRVSTGRKEKKRVRKRKEILVKKIFVSEYF